MAIAVAAVMPPADTQKAKAIIWSGVIFARTEPMSRLIVQEMPGKCDRIAGCPRLENAREKRLESRRQISVYSV
jgi:hypothetical protein